MKKSIILFLTCLLAASAFAQNFDADYSRAMETVRYGKKLYYGAIQPGWTSNDSFVYTTQTPSGDAWYRVTGTQKSEITKEEFEEAMASLRRRYYDPSDESQFAVNREVKRFSPDSSRVAFVRDNNVWVSDADGANPVQLSFDGTDAFTYVELRWAPDGTKLAALGKDGRDVG